MKPLQQRREACLRRLGASGAGARGGRRSGGGSPGMNPPGWNHRKTAEAVSRMACLSAPKSPRPEGISPASPRRRTLCFCCREFTRPATKLPRQPSCPDNQAAPATKLPWQPSCPDNQAAPATKLPWQPSCPGNQAAPATKLPRQPSCPGNQVLSQPPAHPTHPPTAPQRHVEPRGSSCLCGRCGAGVTPSAGRGSRCAARRPSAGARGRWRRSRGRGTPAPGRSSAGGRRGAGPA